MPTFDKTEAFQRGFKHLSKQDQRRFLAVLRMFIDDLEAMDAGNVAGFPFRSALRVKRVLGQKAVWEMTWAPDGRATFTYGRQIIKGSTHIIWLDIGDHKILP